MEFSQERAEMELGRAREALQKELAVSQWVKTRDLEEVNIGEDGQTRPLLVATNLLGDFKMELPQTLREYQDVFAWTYEDIKGLAQLSVVEDEVELVILTQVLDSLYIEDSSGEKRTRPKLI